jgi:spermidine synthase
MYDILILDAFSGDSIPVHLLTRECFELYLKRLRPGGVIAVHISNQHLDFGPVLERLAEHFELGITQIISQARPEAGEYLARWVILTSDTPFLQSPPITVASSPMVQTHGGVRLWTDDDTNLFQILE